MNEIPIEKLIDFQVVFPVTVVKFILNRTKIITILKKMENNSYKSKMEPFKFNSSSCPLCKSRKDGSMCRMHTCIERIASANVVARDIDTGILMCKNEIFKPLSNNRVGIVYCPHTSLLDRSKPITVSRIKKIVSFVLEDDKIQLPEYKNIIDLRIRDLMEKQIKYWFSDEFYLILYPDPQTLSTIFALHPTN